ncbi:response regulator transcription factor [Halobacillus sp. A1]|uniref:response regulator transcription factor n=1 Tax=Halobacillus sp. A1 TaxID=2880262 RepID=UPI0020A6C419|nr:response regulator transcription factor [Halobacillus sp. A1]MCP3033343.1 response regulator transcription factor [Halobacillus sp. A1]
MNILVVDDEFDMIKMLKSYLELHHYTVFTAEDGIDAIEAIKMKNIDLVLLDIMMPRMDGITACKEIRDFSDVPILMLTAKGNEDDRVIGLRSGADDYIVKPFSPKELVARIEATLRRANAHQHRNDQFFRHQDISIDFKGHVVRVNEKTINLTRKEFQLLAFLVRNQGQVFTREHLLDHIWGMDSEGTMRTVDTHVKTLRLKLKSAGSHIQTVWGVGYKFT